MMKTYSYEFVFILYYNKILRSIFDTISFLVAVTTIFIHLFLTYIKGNYFTTLKITKSFRFRDHKKRLAYDYHNITISW